VQLKHEISKQEGELNVVLKIENFQNLPKKGMMKQQIMKWKFQKK
jgi:hypothetical protein